MRWRAKLVGLALGLGVLGGCTQRLFMAPEDYADTLKIGMPRHYETDPHAALLPPQKPDAPAPPTVLDPSRPPRYISLAEAMAIALEQGTEGSPTLNGQFLSELVQGATPTIGLRDDAIKAFALDPAIAGADIERSLSKFDARWISSMTWTKRDEDVGTFLQNLQNGDQATLSTALLKPLPTGGVAGITFSTDYTLLSEPPTQDQQFQVVNPSYRPRLQVSFEQPLLQGFGVEINQLRQSHPGSIVTNLQPSGGQGVEGILVTRLRYDQNKVEFQRRVHNLLRNVELAYWNLYQAYYILFAQEQGLRQAYEAYKIAKNRFEAGRSSIQELAQARAQFEEFRARRLLQLGTTGFANLQGGIIIPQAPSVGVLEAERQLRGLLNLPVEDGTRLVPTDVPTLAPYTPDWQEAVNTMLASRPELTLIRQEVKIRQLDLILQKNFLLPQLNFFANYDVNSLGTQLDGSEAQGNALARLANNDFNTWNLGLRLDIPIGFRDAHAAVRIARLNLARAFAVMKNQELKAERELQLQYQQLLELYEVIKLARATREARAQEMRAGFELWTKGREVITAFTAAQSQYINALTSEIQAIVEYNKALARFQYARGTIMQYNNVRLADGPLPNFALASAMDHFEERTRALVLREREKPPEGLTHGPVSLPALEAHRGPLPELPPDEPLPAGPLGPPGGLTPGAPGLPAPRTLTPLPGQGGATLPPAVPPARRGPALPEAPPALPPSPAGSTP